MRSPINYSGRRFAREVANGYMIGRKGGRQPDSSGCLPGCLGLGIMLFILFLLGQCSH